MGMGDRDVFVELIIPWLARLFQVDDDFLIGQCQLLEGDMRSVGKWAAMVGVERYLGRNAFAFTVCIASV